MSILSSSFPQQQYQPPTVILLSERGQFPAPFVEEPVSLSSSSVPSSRLMILAPSSDEHGRSRGRTSHLVSWNLLRRILFSLSGQLLFLRHFCLHDRFPGAFRTHVFVPPDTCSRVSLPSAAPPFLATWQIVCSVL